MDAKVRRHLDARWHGWSTVAVMPSMKSLTFDLVCAILFGLGRDMAAAAAAVRRELLMEFQQLARGIWAVPVNLPFTTFGRCLAASRRGRHAVAAVIHMLAEGLPREEITDNVIFVIVAALDTTVALITFLLR